MKLELSSKRLTVAYAGALLVVAMLSVASHFVLERAIDANTGAAEVINVSGRQRMLSQRIASLAAQSGLGDPDARKDLMRAIDAFTAAGERLQQGYIDRGRFAPPSGRLRALYFDASPSAMSLSVQMRTFEAQARRIAALPAADPRLKAQLPALFAAAREPLLSSLDAVTTEHQRVSETHLRTLRDLQALSISIVLVTLLAEALMIFRPMVRRIVRANAELRRAATIDPLTGALNRRSFTDQANNELARAARYGRPTALLMIDADHFKAINDTYGHSVGDAVLCGLSVSAGLALRPSDRLGRMGGEEFAVLLPETGLEGAEAAAERVRRAIRRLRVPSDRGDVSLTVSIGVTQFLPTEFGLQTALKRADEALYVAKAAGRDQVRVAAEPEVPAKEPSPFDMETIS